MTDMPEWSLEQGYRPLVFCEQGNGSEGYGLTLVEDVLHKYGIYRDEASGTVLHSSYWPEQIFDLIRWKARNQYTTLITGGNSPTTNPLLYHALGAIVHHGDGELFGTTHTPYLSWAGSDKARIATANTIRPVSGYTDTQKAGKSSTRAFCEISRGCKNNCYYCQYGWLKPYREARIEDIKAVLDNAQTKTIRIFAADRLQHTNYKDIYDHCQGMGKLDSGSDVSMRWILKNKEKLHFVRKMRVGIDGLSERIREAVGKKQTNEQILEAHQLAVEAGIKCIDWYMIYGFPGETDEDAKEFMELLDGLSDIMQGMTLAIHWNAFQPNAMTPLQWEAPGIGAAARARQEQIGRVRFDQKSFKIMHKPLKTNDATVIVRTMLARAQEDHLDMVRAMAWKTALRKRGAAIRRECQRRGLPDPAGTFEIGQPMPWDKAVSYDRETMEKCARRFRRRMGID